jgi:hypothetical protein
VAAGQQVLAEVGAEKARASRDDRNGHDRQ